MIESTQLWPDDTTTPLVEVMIADAFDHASAPRLRALLTDALTLRPQQLIVDLSQCPFVDAVAVEVLLDVHRQIWRTGGRLTLRSPSPRLRRLLRLARVDHVFHVTPPSAPTAADLVSAGTSVSRPHGQQA